MLRAKQKTVSILVAFLTLLAALILGISSLFSLPQTTASAAEATETLTITATGGTLASDSKSISWTGENVSIVNEKNTSSTAIRTSDSAHFRVYVGNKTTFSVSNGGLLTEVAVTNTSSSYATACKNSTLDENVTAAVSGSVVTFTLKTPAESFWITTTSQWRMSQVVITYTEASNDCTHVNLSWVYDSATKEHYQQCDDCETEIENTRAACSEFTYGEYTTVDGVHTRTATCKTCGGEQAESGDCEVSAEYVREGNQHTQTGTCTICGKTTTVTEDCTLSYNNVSNDNGTHNTTSTCSVCEQSATTENVGCTFEEALDGTTLTYTCKYCGYSYEETATTYTVTYKVPNGIAAVESAAVAEGYTTVLPTAETTEGYTFVGWTDSGYEANTTAPANIYEVGSEYEVTADVILYALYTYTEGEAAESWELVTAVSQLADGKEIVIAASGSDYALSTTQNSNNRAAVEITKSGDTITLTTAVQEITLEAGTIDGTWAFNVGNGYLYAASSSSNYLRTQTTNDANGSWAISVTSAGVATIKAQGTNTRNWLRYNSSSKIFACYASGQADVSIYVKTGGQTVFYTTSFDTVCEHTDTRVETVEATCMAAGVERTICNVCGATTGEVELPKLDHDYSGENGICVNGCGEQDPEKIDYSGYYYISFTHSETVYYADNSELSSNRYYAKTEAPDAETVNTNYVYRLEKTATGIYSLYEFDGDLYQEDVTVEKVDGAYRFYATVGGDACQFLLNAGSATKYIKFYKASNATNANYAQDITLTSVALSADMDSATLTLGDDVAVNYYVNMSDEFAEAKMNFTVNGEMYDVEAKAVDGKYVFTLNLAPQFMAENISAVLLFNGVELDKIENYSIQKYAINKLKDAGSSTELKRLVSDMLHYGAAAQLYRGYKTTELANDSYVVENILAASTAEPAATVREIINNPEIKEYPAYFTSVNVWFDAVNKIIIKVNTTENVTLSIDGGEDVAVTSTTIYTDGILATEFDTTYTFVLKCNGVVMQTLTYSVNSYVYAAIADDSGATDEMKALALALYNYGASAEVYGA